MPGPKLLTIELAALYTGRPAATIRGWAHEGRITTYGQGRGNIRYDALELHGATRDERTGEVTPGATPEMPAEPRGRRTAA